MGLVAPQHVGSSRTRARTRVPCIGRRILKHCTAREAPKSTFRRSFSSAAGGARSLPQLPPARPPVGPGPPFFPLGHTLLPGTVSVHRSIQITGYPLVGLVTCCPQGAAHLLCSQWVPRKGATSAPELQTPLEDGQVPQTDSERTLQSLSCPDIIRGDLQLSASGSL